MVETPGGRRRGGGRLQNLHSPPGQTQGAHAGTSGVHLRALCPTGFPSIAWGPALGPYFSNPVKPIRIVAQAIMTLDPGPGDLLHIADLILSEDLKPGSHFKVVMWAHDPVRTGVWQELVSLGAS